jgi:antitoxin component YwqK of YwqJK toxin-antitoxin module
MKQDITPRNKQRKPHGRWECYYPNGQLSCKANYTNGKLDGYLESYYLNGKLWSKGNYINGKEDGLWMWGNYQQIRFYI